MGQGLKQRVIPHKSKVRKSEVQELVDLVPGGGSLPGLQMTPSQGDLTWQREGEQKVLWLVFFLL